MVFLHGYPLNHSMWERQLDSISRDHRVVLLELSGEGQPEGEPVPETLRDYSDRVFWTLVATHSTGVVLVGHSFGGYIALQFQRDHPELLSGLVLTDTRAEPDAPEARERRLATVRRLEQPGQGLDVDATARALLAPPHWEAGGPLVESVRTMVRTAPVPSVRGALKAIANRPDLTAGLRSISVPTLVIWGDQDQLIPPPQSQSMVARIPGAVGVGIPEAGHLPPMEAPGSFDRALLDFLKRAVDP